MYRLVGDIGELEVPDSLHALLAARLDVLDPRTRHVLTDAAVLGTSFPAEAVVAVSGLEPDEVSRILSDLLRREVLEVSADPLSPERGTYRFAQEMLRQVAYETLSRRDPKVAAPRRSPLISSGRFPTTARRSSTSSPDTTSTPSKQYPTTPTPARSAS